MSKNINPTKGDRKKLIKKSCTKLKREFFAWLAIAKDRIKYKIDINIISVIVEEQL
ncbi:MAG: hypothetical protein K8R41_01590 [Bacteroidales bacterium]|nr:hypothetical protein [Bacteroidales bacterium]